MASSKKTPAKRAGKVSSSGATFPSIPPASKSEAHEWAVAKLESSGLTEADMKELRMDALGPLETAKLHSSFKSICSLRIPYFDPTDLNKPLSAMPKWPAFYRLRYLRPDGDKKDDIRYTNEPLAGVVAYFPPNVDWPSIVDDADTTLIITEGELKAAKACREGYPTIGLGGVWNFRSSSLGLSFLPCLEAFNWVKRRVYIVFDSDIIVKSGVQDALNSLAEELMLRGALPFIVLVPEGHDGQKQGLDDWCVNNPGSTIAHLVARHQPLTQVRKLFELNQNIVYVMDKGLVVEQATANKMTGNQFKEGYLNIDYSELTISEDGSVSLKKAPIAVNWLKWPMRNQVNTMTYKPGAERIVANLDHSGRSAYNLWPGWGVEALEGDVSPFLELVDHIFAGVDPSDKEWFLRWCAYPLQYPGTKLFTAAVIHGTKHGTGKSLLGYTLAKIYGSNFTEINQPSLHAGFNGWAEAKQFVMGDDVTGSNKREDNDLLKKLITQKELRVNTKFMPEYVVPDCINYFFTSNHPDSFFLEDDDRRFFIHEVSSPPMHEDFYAEYDLWLHSGGASYLFNYLLNYDLGMFNPAAPAKRTIAKDQMTADTKSDLGSWVQLLKSDPDAVLKVGSVVVPGDLFTSADLLAIYDPEGTKRLTANGMTRELRRSAVMRANKGIMLKGPSGPGRYFILRNVSKWIEAEPAELVKQLNLQATGGMGKTAKKY
jgi:Domain of unknown function (DUF3854)/Family of unknown function (DUF5906)